MCSVMRYMKTHTRRRTHVINEHDSNTQKTAAMYRTRRVLFLHKKSRILEKLNTGCFDVTFATKILPARFLGSLPQHIVIFR